MAKMKFDNIRTDRADDNKQAAEVFRKMETSASAKRRNTEAPEEEKEWRKAEMKTQGRTGCKSNRINMAFSTDNYQYLSVMAKALGTTMTRLCNDCVDQYRQAHQADYDRTMELRKKMGIDK